MIIVCVFEMHSAKAHVMLGQRGPAPVVAGCCCGAMHAAPVCAQALNTSEASQQHVQSRTMHQAIYVLHKCLCTCSPSPAGATICRSLPSKPCFSACCCGCCGTSARAASGKPLSIATRQAHAKLRALMLGKLGSTGSCNCCCSLCCCCCTHPAAGAEFPVLTRVT